MASLVGILPTLVYLYKTRSFDLDAATKSGKTVLTCALLKAHEDIVQMLEWNAKTSLYDIRTAIRRGIDAGILQVLMERLPQHYRHPSRELELILTFAVLRRNSKVVGTLPKSGITNPYHQVFENTKALIYACQKGRTEIVQLLLEHGFDAKVVDSVGNSASDMAMQHSSDTKIVRMLRAKGALTWSERAELESGWGG